MPYFTPYIDTTGLHIPTYTDIRDQLVQDAKDIFGQDIYLEADSQDYQYISAMAEKIYDAFQLAQYVYNNRGPSTAIGVALDSIIKLNGIKRKAAVYSTCLIAIAGITGTQIINGVVADVSGTYWNLPSLITIPEAGSIEVIATCQVSGPIPSNIGDINTIVTPTYGWDSVTNNQAAVVGIAQETDAELRARQALSTSLASLTLLEGTKGSLAAISGVTRFAVYENDTADVDANGLPAHSITCVVEGGTDPDIADAVYNNKGIGCYTNGDVVINITDSFGQSTPIRFFRPVYQNIDLTINVKALSGYTTDITDQIKSNLVDYLNGLSIGEDLRISSLWGVALTAMNDLKNPLFSITGITAGLHGQVQSTNDIAIGFKEVTQGNIDYITVNVS